MDSPVKKNLASPLSQTMGYNNFGATMGKGFLLNHSKYDILNNLESELPFHRTELETYVERFVGNNLDFIDKESLSLTEIKDHHLNFGEWKTQISNKGSNFYKLLNSKYFVDEESEAT